MRKRVSIVRMAIGLVLILTSAGIFRWKTRRDRMNLPVDIAIPAFAQGVTVDRFSVPEAGDYLVAISSERTIPDDTLFCLLGISDPFDRCKSTPSVINAVWVLSVAHGSSNTEQLSASSEIVYRGIGEFHLRPGQSYRLDTHFLTDISPLNPTKPRIQISWLPPTDSDEYGDSLKYELAKPTGIVLLTLGLILFAFDAVRFIRNA